MSDSRDDAEQLYVVLTNAEEQYSLWPHQKPIPAGWRKAHDTASKSDCLKYVDEVWKDLTPLSLRRDTSLSS